MASITVTGKRKRAQISYSVDDYFDQIDLDILLEKTANAPTEDTPTESDMDEEEDIDFGSRRKPKSRKAKKAKLSLKSKTEKKEKPFPFLQLPPELRDEIYDLALTDPAGIFLVSKTKAYRRTVIRGSFTVEDESCYYGTRRGRGYWSQNITKSSQPVGDASRTLIPNLLAASKQTREEATSVLYKQKIVLEDTTALLTFIAQIGPHNRTLLSQLVVKGWGDGRGVHKGHNFAALSFLSACINLKSLFLDCTIGCHRSPRLLARQVFRDGHYFLEAFGAANGRYDAAIDILQMADEFHFDKNRNGYYSWRPDVEEVEIDPAKKQEFEDELRHLLRG